MPDRERFALLLEPMGGSWAEVPPAARLARAAKALRRSHGLRLVKVKKVPPKAEKVKVTP